MRTHQNKHCLQMWQNFRYSLENSKNPIQDTIDFFKNAPWEKPQFNIVDVEHWPNPWQIIESNRYCDWSQLLIIAYTLMLTNKFKNSTFELKKLETNNQINYVIIIDHRYVIGYDNNTFILNDLLPADSKLTFLSPILLDK